MTYYFSYVILLGMSYYARYLSKKIKDHFRKYPQVLVLLGARQVGKTTLLKKTFPEAFFLSVDNEPVRQNLERYDINVYKQILPLKNKIVVIDEIHLLKDPGRCAKIIFDHLPDIKLVITGSSSLKIRNRASESLAGRKIDYHLFPLTFSEILYQKGIREKLDFKILENILYQKTEPRYYSFDVKAILENVLLYGGYPFLIDHPQDTIYLKNLTDSVVFKDLLDLNLIGNRQVALNLLRLLSYQIGSLVNYSDLANRLEVNVGTVKRYLEIFEQSFIVFSLSPFTSKRRDEIGKAKKYYFYDLGLRNSLIDNFQPLTLRQDFGFLFENFIISEVLKANSYLDLGLSLNFWRNKQGSEIDLVLIDKKGTIFAVEIKTGKRRERRAFFNRYPKAKIFRLNLENFY